MMIKKTFTLISLISLIALPVALVACASISVQPGTAVATQQMPMKVYVEAFSTDGDFKVDRDGQELVAFKTDLQAMMVAGVTTDLSKRLIPAVAAPNDFHPQREKAWLMRGRFTRVNQGSRLLRGAIGFGAGGSNAEPGAVPTLATDPLSLVIEAAGGAGNVAHGVTEDTNRTAREITAELSDYMYRSHWISEDKWIQPKQYSN